MESDTTYSISIDADGQYTLSDIQKIFSKVTDSDNDLIIGMRLRGSSGSYREFGKLIIRKVSRILVPNDLTDLNSVIKIYRTDQFKSFLHLCPDNP